MTKTVLKGADAFIVQRRPVLRAIAYAIISLMSLVNLAMLSSSWSNSLFMRNNGAFTGTFVVSSSVVTMIIGGMYAIATAVLIRARVKDAEPPKFCQRLAKDSMERLVCCLMATWWLSMALNISNVAFMFRDEIRRCIQNKARRDTAANACTAFHGSLALCWLTWLMWIGRTWRVFTRSNMHFDSSIFQHAENSIDLQAIKPMTALYDASLQSPDVYQAVQAKHSNLDADGQLANSSKITEANACVCANCPLSRNAAGNSSNLPPQTLVATHRVCHAGETAHDQRPYHSHAHFSQCTPAIGTATLVTERINDD
ncbi:hypothetical protein IWW42_001094 [Coemansia sp. RSA 1085]|nr:hypothetical protein IWW42_001094 [Coemansia sp. RSA 1085]